MEFPLASRPTVESGLAWARGADPISAWCDVVDSMGWRRLAEATAFRGDPHWPGERPSSEWWQSVLDDVPADAADAGLDPGVQPWLDAVRDGAAIAIRAMSADGDVWTAMRTAVRWRTWRRREVLTFGGGPRFRPVGGQDDQGRFVLAPGMVVDRPSLVDLVVGAGKMSG
jgi:hypothetical protein